MSNFNIEALKSIKINARLLQKLLKIDQEKISYQTCLQTLAKQYGFDNWNTASAYAKSNNIIIFDAPKTNPGEFSK